jgi:5-methylcytosine-specific restriction protein B
MATTNSELKQKIIYEVIPLVKEYIKDGILSVRPEEAAKWFDAWKQLTTKKEAVTDDSAE